MKVLLFESWNQTPQFETGLELAEHHARQGHEVTYVNIGGDLPFLEWHTAVGRSPLQRRFWKQVHRYKMKRARRVLDQRVTVASDPLVSGAERAALCQPMPFAGFPELRAYEWQGIDLGMAALSSLISITNDLAPDLEANGGLLQDILGSARIAGASFDRWLQQVKPDLVYFRNGRVAAYRPVLRICQQRGIRFLLHDRGCDKHHYSINTNFRHDVAMVTAQIEEAWQRNPNEAEKVAIATRYYADRRRGVEQAWVTFIDKQQAGQLPPGWDPGKRNVVFFTSSIGEFAAVSDALNPDRLFPSQDQAVVAIAEMLRVDPNSRFYVRLHPNLRRQSQKEQDIWRNVQHPNVTFIAPDSPVDTYSLVDHADLVVVYLTTVGIEAAFAGKPVILIGRAAYQHLDAVHVPETVEAFQRLLLSQPLKPRDRAGSLKYGYYMSTFGTRYEYFQPVDLHSGTFKGVNLQSLPGHMEILRAVGQHGSRTPHALASWALRKCSVWRKRHAARLSRSGACSSPNAAGA